MALIDRKGTVACVETENGKRWQVYVDDNGILQVEEYTLE
jgi:hypothetical protein